MQYMSAFKDNISSYKQSCKVGQKAKREARRKAEQVLEYKNASSKKRRRGIPKETEALHPKTHPERRQCEGSPYKKHVGSVAYGIIISTK